MVHYMARESIYSDAGPNRPCASWIYTKDGRVLRESFTFYPPPHALAQGVEVWSAYAWLAHVNASLRQ